MSESRSIEIYEIEIYSSGKWIPDEQRNWTTLDNQPSRPPDELTLPNNEWCWESNWRIIKKPGATDRSGWEYASKPERFTDPNRTPKPEKMWNDRARRRKWSRIMRRDTRASKAQQFIDSMPVIQKGLRSIYALRVKIEDAVKQTPDAMQEPQMIRHVDTVRQNMYETMNLLNQLDSNGLTTSQVAVINKLRNDLQKEQDALEKAIALAQQTSPFPPLLEKRRSNIGGGLTRAPSSSSSLGQTQSSSYRNPQSVPPSPQRAAVPRGHSSSSLTNNGSFSGSLGGIASGTPRMGRGPSIPRTNSNMTPMGTPLSDGRYMASSSSSGVVSGGRNVPLSFSFNSVANDGNEEGMFVQRTDEELVIEQKLIPIDEGEVQARIIEERAAAIEEIHKGLVEVNEMFTDLSKFIKDQQGEVNKILANTEESHARTAEAFSQIVQADRLQQEANCIIS